LYDNPEKEVVNDFVLQWLGLNPNLEIFIFRPWTLLTNLFLHLRFWHILFNMIVLWLAGWIFSQFMPAKRIYWFYFLGGVFGNVLFVLLYNYLPVFERFTANAVAFGAIGGVFTVLAAAATKVPNYPIRLFLFGEVRLKWIAIVLIVCDFITIPNGNSGGHFGHLGSALLGFLLVFVPILKEKIQLQRPKKEPKCRPNTAFRPKTDEQYNAEMAEYRKQVDTVLDKVAKSGYSSLSKEEKEFLFNTSKKKNW